MGSEPAICVTAAAKKYCRTLRHTMTYGATDLLRDFFDMQGNSATLRPGEFWAVNGASFTVRRGECLGLIGPNGSGKSTLLKMLNGIFMPDRGEIRVNGRVGALIEVGAGFHPLLTGRENVYVNGAILGMSRREIDEKFDAILDFADIGDFIDAPVKHYSSGMYVRLGFAVAAQMEPDILLIDEALAVGDLAFQVKCHNRIRSLLEGGAAAILVSHNLYHIQRSCSKALLLEAGNVTLYGEAAVVTGAYEGRYGGVSLKALLCPENGPDFDFMDIVVMANGGTLSGPPGSPKAAVTGTPLQMVISYRLLKPAKRGVQIGMLIKTFDGQRVFGCTTREGGIHLPVEQGDYRLCFEMDNLLLQGNYEVSLSAFDGDYAFQLAVWEKAASFRVTTPEFDGLRVIGVVRLPYRAQLL